MAKSKTADTLDAKNASVLAELVVDPLTTDHSRVAILNMLLSTQADKDFFTTMFREGLSFGNCPECNHQRHWLIPEDILNQMGWVSAEQDDRVKRHTNINDCPVFQEACSKKTVIY